MTCVIKEPCTVSTVNTTRAGKSIPRTANTAPDTKRYDGTSIPQTPCSLVVSKSVNRGAFVTPNIDRIVSLHFLKTAERYDRETLTKLRRANELENCQRSGGSEQRALRTEFQVSADRLRRSHTTSVSKDTSLGEVRLSLAMDWSSNQQKTNTSYRAPNTRHVEVSAKIHRPKCLYWPLSIQLSRQTGILDPWVMIGRTAAPLYLRGGNG